MKRLRVEDLERISILSLVGLFLFLILLSLAELSPFTLANADLEIENARSILDGVGVEGLSAIFAIVISLTLMAVQFASQQYTHRIMDLHIKSLTFWSVITVYLTTMLYNVFLLGRLEAPVEIKYINVSMLLTTLSFIMLIPFFSITMIRLRPETVIDNMLMKVDTAYLNSIKDLMKEGEMRIAGELDKLLPITEIIEKSIGNGDRGTVRFGLGEIYDRYMANLTPENESYVSPYFLGHILGIGREAIIEADDDTIVQVLEIFGEVGTHTITQNMNFTTQIALEYLDIIGFKGLKEYDIATQQMINSLHGMLRELMKLEGGNREIFDQIFTLYHDISDELYTLKKYRMEKYLTNSFVELSEAMVEQKQGEMIDRTGGLLESIGIFAVNLDIRNILYLVVHLLHEIGLACARNKVVWNAPKGTVNLAERIIDHLLKVEGETLKYKSKSKEFDIIINQIEFARKDIEKYLEKGTDFSDLWA
jgi:hypothetical protein